MLDRLFLSVLNMSITASFVIFGVLLVRFFLKKAPKIFSYALWAIVLFRLICPFSFESAVGLLPVNTTPIPQDIIYQAQPQIDTGIPGINNSINPLLPAPPQTVTSVNPLQIWVFIGSRIWLAGMAVLLIYSMLQLVRLKRRLMGATPLEGNIYLADHAASPFVMGFIRPNIYLPSSMAAGEQAFIIAHEQCHLKRLDHIVRMLAFIALTLHWFNPLVWLAFVLSGKDMEMSCDETVIKKMGSDIRAEYSQSLLRFAAGKKPMTGTPLAFGEGDTKDRVKNVMHYKKPVLWVSIAAAAAVVCISVGLMSNPKQTPAEVNDSSVQSLWKHRTKYVGDNAAVGNILSELTYPEQMQYNGFQLFTKLQPYAITVNLTTDTETRNFYAGSLNQAPLNQNAIILFALIENVDIINFSLDDNKNPYSESFHRESAQAIMDNENLFAATETVKGLDDLIREAEKRLNSPMNADAYENQGISDFKGVELYVWKNETDETCFTLLSGTNRYKTEAEIYDSSTATTDLSKIADTLLEFDDGLQLFLIQMNKADFTKEEMTAFEKEINTYIGDTIKNYSIHTGLFKPESQKDTSAGPPGYNTEADFLNHPDGIAFQAAAYKAAKAYLNGDKEELSAYITENCTVDADLDLFKDIDYMLLKWSLSDIKAEDQIHAAYEFKLKGEDSVSYVSMELKKIKGEWSIDSIGLEK